MKRAGVAGSPIAHSLSPVLHNAAYDSLGVDIEYGTFETEAHEITSLLDRLDDSWVGLSLTMPLKQVVIEHLDFVDGLAKTVGAVNTVCFQPANNLRVGFNTDVYGIAQAVREQGDISVPSAIILGARATASSALAACVELDLKDHITLAARNHGGPGSAVAAATRMNLSPALAKLDERLVPALAGTGLLISSLPAGIADGLAQQIDEQAPDLSRLMILDVVYHPWPSELVRAAQNRGARIVPGWAMLLHQAVSQVRLFTNRTPDVEVMKGALLSELERR
ncbi:shikimate dehydrogenase family protein [Flaviflexus huanghaiensis]|uniref:shikimate dehydrogenase family protein n=1 Tax=Flaviflexus huanghaiensis TaxID=1111473 RepID=UPI0015FB5514|nr:shikimate dehydrogenase [Flaviflexus huanghaiensis]